MKSIEVHKICKSYDREMAVEDINFNVNRSELFGLIGPDGAGKTTLFRILTSLLIPDAGTAYVESLHTVRDYKKIRRIIGYMPGKFSLYQDLTVEENLQFFATIFNTSIKENYHLIEEIYIQIEPFKKRRAGKLSGGMKQKLALCCALIHEPQVLFLDEPTTGVDAVSRTEFWEMLGRLKAKGITILVSTPYMDEARLCERIALIQDGRIMQIDTPTEIVGGYNKPLFQVTASDYYRLLGDLRSQAFTLRAEPFGEYLHLTTTDDCTEDMIHQYIEGAGHTGVEISRTTATIEDVFLDLMKTESHV